MRYGVGIDLGTSFTSAAVSGPHGTHMVSLGPDVIVPSVAYPTPDGTVLTGSAALDAAAGPGRVTRGFKRRLGDPTPLMLGGSPYSPTTLMAAQLRHVLATVTGTLGAPPASITLTCPAIWGPYRREQFAEVPRLAGVTGYRLITEPEAAATHYSAERRLGDGEVVAVYDLGGGTFDTTVLRMRGDGMEILGTPEGIEHMGGIDFDATLLAHVDDRLDGAISALDPADPAATTALAAINAMCVRAKEELSTEPDVRLSVPLPSGPTEVTITRLEFNDMIRPSIRLTADALRRTIGSAGLRPEDLSAVLLAGGSSHIPLVTQLVSEEFGKPVRVALHPKFTVALGAAAVAARPAEAPGAPLPATAAVQVVAVAEPKPTASRARRKWLVPAIAATLVVVAGATTTLLLNSSDGQAQESHTAGGTTTRTTTSTTATTSTSPTTGPSTSASTVPTTGATAEPAPAPAPEPTPQTRPRLQVFDGGAVEPWVGLISSQENWSGTGIGADGARQGPITATREGAKGLRVTWSGTAAQVYLQSNAGPWDLTSYVEAGGALVFDVAVHKPPAGFTNLAAHCEYPCGADVPVAGLFQQLTPDRTTTVKIPLSCFTSAGLDSKKVNTPFLVYTEQPFDATFSDVRWEAGAAADQDATPCANLR